MDPDKVILQKLWETKWTRWLMIIGLGWQVLSGLKEPVVLVYEHGIQRAFRYVSGSPPNPDAISDDRQAFIAGYFIYQLHPPIMEGGMNAIGYSVYLNIAEGALLALGFPNTNLVHEIGVDRFNHKRVDALQKYFRVRDLAEAYIDKKGKTSAAAYQAGVDIGVLIHECSTKSPSQATIREYSSELRKHLATVRDSTPYRFPRTPAEEVASEDCNASQQQAYVDTYLKLSRFYGVSL